MTIALVVFDMAGTTVRDDGGAVNRCLRAALAAAGLSVRAEAVNAVMGLPKPEALQQLISASPLGATLLPQVGAIHEDFVGRMIDFYGTDPSVGPVAGAAAVFARLRAAGVRVALDTGFSRRITNVVLERLGWADGRLIDATVTSDEVARGRPHPDMIQVLMARCGVGAARDVAKVGDTPADLLEGANAGCGMIVGVTNGSHTLAQLQPFPHTHLIASVTDLPALLGL